MAVIQISKIQVRRGLQENLPQLASGELGWSIDTQRLWIGNGTLQEGAPEIGNTEILTAGTRLPGVLAALYTFEGAEASPPYLSQTGPSLSLRVERRIQDKIDEQISLRDFITGTDKTNGDYTEALQRAIDQIYPVGYDDSYGIRRVLHIPAGVYEISNVITVPPYASIVGDGKNSTIIRQKSALAEAVFKFRDSLAQVDNNLGNGSAVLPSYVRFENITLENSAINEVIIIDSASNISFNSVKFSGPYINTLSLGDQIAGVLIQSTADRSKNITFDQCEFTRSTFGIKCIDDVVSVSISNSNFNILYQGLVLEGVVVSPRCVRVTSSVFDNVASHGIYSNNDSSSISAYNYYALVGRGDGSTMNSGAATAAILKWNTANNYSIADVFDRTLAESTVFGLTEVVTYTSATQQHYVTSGTLRVFPGSMYVIANNDTTATNLILGDSTSYIVDYVISRSTDIRVGTLKITNIGGVATYDDEYTESADIGVAVVYTTSSTDVVIEYTTTNTGFDATVKYNLRTFG
jgi:hypothetical protein